MIRTTSNRYTNSQRASVPLHLLLAGILICVTAASASAVTIDATDRGWYNSAGDHSPELLNYLTGDCRGSKCSAGTSLQVEEFRSFFVFDLSAVTGPIAAATLRLENPGSFPGFSSDEGSETYRVSDVSTSIAALIAGTAGLPAFADLGSGTVFGSFDATTEINGALVEIDLNSAAIDAMNLAPGLFAFGGALTTLNGFADEETVFAFSDAGILSDTQLDLVLIPEPNTSVLLAAGLAVLGALGRRQRS